MSAEECPTSWRDPRYVSTVVGVLATGALYFYNGLTGPGPTAAEIPLVIVIVLGPTAIAHEAARRRLQG